MLKKIWKYAKVSIITSPGLFLLSLIMIFIFRLSQLGMDFSLKLITDVLLESQNPKSIDIVLTFVLFFFFICIGGNTGNLNNMFITMYTNKAKIIFAKIFMYRAYKEKQDSFYDNEFYNNYEFIKKNIDSTTEINVMIFNKLLSALVSLLICVTAITYFSPLILIFIAVISAIMVLINQSIIKKRVALDKEYINDERRANYYSKLLADKPHAKELRIYRLKNFFLNKWSNSFKKFSIEKYKFEKKALIIGNIPGLAENILSSVLIIFFLSRVNSNLLTVGNFVLLYRIMWRITYGVSYIIQIVTTDIAKNYKYIEKYDEFVGDLNGTVKEIKNYDVEKNSKLKYGPFNELVLENVSYSYPQQKGNAVNNVNLKIKKGEIVSILGYNGSGKSTLSKLICGLHQDYTGTIKLNNHDISKMKKEDLYKYFGIGFQDFTKYSISLKDNVGIGMIEDISNKEEIKQAVAKGNLKEIVDRLPNDVETILGKEYDSNGQDLSGGQWQRVILSRAYMGEPEILILDEPTASVDPIEEMRVLKYFNEIIKDKTAILISHRIGFARLSNRICIMENGQIVEDGTHDELLKLKGRYYELFTSQKDLYEEEGA